MSSTAIVVTSGKGGVGKTTATANIGAALAMNGPKVALVDADIGLRNLDLVLGLENRIIYDLVNVVEGRAELRKALIKHKHVENLSLLPAAQTRDKNAVSPEQMRKLVSDLKKDFDFILLDCPAGIEQGFKNAIAGADKAIVVTTPEMSAVRDADRIIGMLMAEGIDSPMLVVNRIRPDMIKRHDMLTVDDLLEHLKVDLLGVVPDDESIIVSTNKGLPAVMDSKSKAGKEFKKIAARLMGEDVAEAAATAEPGDEWFVRLIKWFRGERG
ncbi:MAG: septum site-determining protein MinD [Bacillota bacterium]|jgi:septum site-determining protein MinD|nr:septum site-determining protein MinD [Bacillota bacterium]